MVGVGAVFEGYRDGLTEDDDDVALEHGPAELGYLPLTEAMVNVRATLTIATRDGVLLPEPAAAITAIAKAMFYKDRTWPRVLAAAGAQGLAGAARLQAWLPTNVVDLKRADALLLVDLLRAHTIPVSPRGYRPVLAHTAYWEELRRHVGC